jgi:hypothetical protein
MGRRHDHVLAAVRPYLYGSAFVGALGANVDENHVKGNLKLNLNATDSFDSTYTNITFFIIHTTLKQPSFLMI